MSEWIRAGGGGRSNLVAVAAGAAAERRAARDIPASARATAGRDEESAERGGFRIDRQNVVGYRRVVAALADGDRIRSGGNEGTAMEERSATTAAAGAVAARAAATDDEDFDEAALRESNRAGGGRIGERVDRIAVQDGMRLHRRGGNARDAGLEGDAFRFGRVAARRGNGLGIPAIRRPIRKSRNLQAEGTCGVDVLRRGRGEIALPFRQIDLHGGAACGTWVNRPRHVEAAVARVGERDIRKRRAVAGRNRDDIAVGVAVCVRVG